ncbi:Cytochrome P450 714B3 [Dendrobium catenatum]|uniref:Cytochrome P450 714B3 n=1 Tax=Dendrobium catenatum TaxID=906689 RepID=A0A2I0XHL6_9ASPA|nr:Cytochrome P450 714B3 [Dendrobium catenatum]
MLMDYFLSFLLLVFCGFALHFYYNAWIRPEKIRRKLRRQGIGGPPPAFLHGNMKEAKRLVWEEKAGRRGEDQKIRHDYTSSVFPYFERWRNMYGMIMNLHYVGPIFLYTMGNVPMLHVSDPDLVREMNLCKSLDLGKATYLQKTHEPLFGHGILKSSGESWAHQRKIIAPEFYMDKVKGMVELMVDSAIPLLETWEKRIEKEGGTAEINIDEDLKSFSADVISRASFGSSYSKGKQMFLKLYELKKAVSKPNLLVEITGIRYVVTMVIQEVLRLYPPGPVVSREALQDMKVGGIQLPKGINIFIPVPTMHQDLNIWGPDACEFNPKRFEHGVMGACKLPQMYLPFGAGPRTCLGQNFAMVELKIVLALILQKFSFTLSNNYKHSPTLRLIVEPEDGVDLIVKKVL